VAGRWECYKLNYFGMDVGYNVVSLAGMEISCVLRCNVKYEVLISKFIIIC